MREFRIYRPNKAGNGAATKFQLREDKQDSSKVVLFMECAQQVGADENGNAKFAWRSQENPNLDKSVTVLLGDNDVGEILGVLNGLQEHVGGVNKDGKPGSLFHENKNGNTIVNLGVSQKGGLWLSVSSNRKDDGIVTKVGHGVGVSDAQILKVLLERFLARKYGW